MISNLLCDAAWLLVKLLDMDFWIVFYTTKRKLDLGFKGDANTVNYD